MKKTAAQNLGERTLSGQMISEAFLELSWAEVTELNTKSHFPSMDFLCVCLLVHFQASRKEDLFLFF